MRNPIMSLVTVGHVALVQFPRPNRIALVPMTVIPGTGCNAVQQRGDELLAAVGTIPVHNTEAAGLDRARRLKKRNGA